MRSLLLAALLLAPQPALEVRNDVTVTRPDGSTVPFAPSVRVWCGRWEEDVPRRAVHVWVGARGAPPFWQLSAVVADVRRRRVVRFPHSFVWNRPSGARLFAADGDNELSSAVEEASGRITFDRARCGRRMAVRFNVDAVLGSEFFDGEPVTMRGRFRARADL